MGRKIRVSGKGKMAVKPDTISINIEAKGTYSDYAETLNESTKQTKILRQTMEQAGLKGEDLKTKHFAIETKYENYRDEHDDYKSRFVGYQYRHVTSIKFAKDNKQLGCLLFALANSKTEVEFTIQYTLLDQEKVKNELLTKAVTDAKGKAEVLAAASGVLLGEIQYINYSWDEIEIASRPMNRMMALGAGQTDSFDVDIEAEDIHIEDTVTLEWEIL